jgi:hypothetical protein
MTDRPLVEIDPAVRFRDGMKNLPEMIHEGGSPSRTPRAADSAHKQE